MSRTRARRQGAQAASSTRIQFRPFGPLPTTGIMRRFEGPFLDLVRLQRKLIFKPDWGGEIRIKVY
jgi:hypothetical protein